MYIKNNTDSFLNNRTTPYMELAAADGYKEFTANC